MIARADALKAIDDGFLQALTMRVQIFATNELNEKPEDAEGQFKRGLIALLDAHDRATDVVKSIFPET